VKPLTWLFHLLFLAALTTELGLWRRGHRSIDELATLAQKGRVDQRLDALHQLANRSLESAQRLPSETAMLHDQERRVQDFFFTSAFVRHMPIDKTKVACVSRRKRLAPIHELLQRREDDPRALRWAFFLCNNLDLDVEEGLWMPFEEIDAFFDACAGKVASHEQVLALLESRYPRARFERDREKGR
jgi:hypothetical protein